MKKLTILMLSAALTLLAPACWAQTADPHAGHDHAPGEGHEHDHSQQPGKTRSSVAPKRLTDSELRETALLAIQEEGRKKPLDTFANEALLSITGRPTIKAFDQKWRPVDFLLSAMIEDRPWAAEPIILVGSHKLRAHIGLDPDRNHFSFDELAKQMSEGGKLRELVAGAHTKRQDEEKLDGLETEGEAVVTRIEMMRRVMSGSSLLIVPAAKNANDPWVLPPDFAKYYTAEQFNPIMEKLQAMAGAYLEGNGFATSRAARELRTALRELSPDIYPSEKDLELEYTYNHLQAFKTAAFLFIVGSFLIASAIFASNRGYASAKWLRAGAVIAAVAGVALETAGIVLRCIIAGRPPVTNMFESVIWVSFIVGVLGLIFYFVYRADLYLLAAMPVAAFSVLLVLQIPGAMPADINPLVPVLRDNFWLTIHVLTIVMSYGAFALAMAFGHIILGMYAANPKKTREDLALHFWLYRIIQLGVLLLGIGTILGGVWANYSWGRFWGWDPKETWALIALLCYILAIHGRIAGWWSHFGMAVASVVCFLAVITAWYGVNYVFPAGLHSYGQGNGGEKYVYIFAALDGLFVAFASWRYFSAQPKKVAKPSGESASERPTTDTTLQPQ